MEGLVFMGREDDVRAAASSADIRSSAVLVKVWVCVHARTCVE